jgi:exopolysaccharide production protein ExoQ
MSKASAHSVDIAQRRTSASTFDKFIILPVLACAYAEIISPLLIHMDTGPLAGGAWTEAQHQIMMAPRLEHRIFWPAMAAISLVWAVRNRSRLFLAPHLIFLFAHLALAGASVSWAFKPDMSFIRFAQQAMIIISIIIPALAASRTADLMRGVFWCFALALIINLFFVLDENPMIQEGRIFYAGYFTFKGALGQCAAFALLLSVYEILFSGLRRMLGIAVVVIAIYLVVISDSKGSLAFALLAPSLAGIALFIAKRMRVSPAIVLLPIPVFYFLLSSVIGNLINRISWHLYGNYHLSGRVFIWDFAKFEIARKPLLGWGYQSFWLVGPDAPSIVDAPGWIKNMPNAHSGYLDTMVDMGYVGIVSLVIFVLATIHAIGRLAQRDIRRAWLLLSLALYVVITNFIETGWMHGTDILWLMFLIVAAEAARYWQPSPVGITSLTRSS